ncbi:MAG: hypothetical protein C4293_06560 [Nitrospiraceae bacterium]
MAELKVDLPPDIKAEEARVLLMIKLFEAGRLSLGQAAKAAGYSKRAFLEVLRKHGVSVLDYPRKSYETNLSLERPRCYEQHVPDRAGAHRTP